jgi:tripartite-type tricarboxylate transporter receptor subunit TctC
MRRRALFGGMATLSLLPKNGARAQPAWPSYPVRWLVPFPPGGNTDAVARIAAQYFEAALRMPMPIENRGGAGGILGTAVVAKAPPDGYTLLVGSLGALTVSPALEQLPYDPLKDLTPVSLLNTNPLVVIVRRDSPITTLQDLIARARAQPGKLNYGSSGVGGLMHISPLLFQTRIGTELTHVPYRGGAPATSALLSGDIDLIFANMSDALPQVASGSMRALAVTAPARSPQMPDVPTIAECGLDGYAVESWNGLLAPAGTPHAVVERLAAIAAAMAKDPGVQQRMAQIGSLAVANTPQDFAKMLQDETVQWAALLRQAGLARAP